MRSGRTPSTGPDAVRGELADLYRRISRLRHASIGVIALAVLLVGGTLWLGGDIRSDPTDRAMRELELPAWENAEIHEDVEGSRWCWQSCRVRARTWNATEDLQELKDQVRDTAVQRDWSDSAVVECEGSSLCLVRDDLLLHLQIQPANCDDEELECASTVASLVITSQASWPRIDS